MKTTRILAAVVGGLGLSFAAVASAQQNAPLAPAAGAQAGPAHGWDPARMRERFEQRRQRRLQVLHDALGLRADQEGAWRTFVASRRPPSERGPGLRSFEHGQRQALNTPERLDRISQRMAEQQARFARRADSIKRFYAVLDARQQKTFDALVMARFGGRGMGRGHWARRGPMGPPPPEGQRD